MAVKTIKAPFTLHVRDDKKSVPFKYDSLGALIEGRHVVIECPPMTPVTLDADEADDILARFPAAVECASEDKAPAPKGDGIPAAAKAGV